MQTGANLSRKHQIQNSSLLSSLSPQGMNIDDKNSDDYGDLPPVQRRKKIVQKIDQINASIQQELAVR